MGYYNNDIAGLFTSDDKRSRGNVAGASTGRRHKRETGDAADACCDRKPRNDDDQVLGTFDNIRIPVNVNAYVNSEDICRAVRRCLINDLVAGIEDEDDNGKKKHHKRR